MEPPERPEPGTGPGADPATDAGPVAAPDARAESGIRADGGAAADSAAGNGADNGTSAATDAATDAGTLSLPTLSTGSWIVVSLAVAAVAVGVAFHLAMVFLHVAPSNTASKEYQSTVDSYVYPEFEQNWKLFAPDPLQQNIHVQARAEVRAPNGALQTTGWVDLTDIDLTGIRHTVAPSHTHQNELRRAWSFYTSSHGANNQPTGVRGQLSQEYVQRIVENRFGPKLNGGDVVRVQVRSATSQVAAPSWSDTKANNETQYQETLWWSVATSGQEKAS